MIVIDLNFFQALWFTWIKWLWKIYTADSHWLSGPSNSRSHGYISPNQGDWCLWHVCIGSCHKLWRRKVEIGERSRSFSCTGLFKFMHLDFAPLFYNFVWLANFGWVIMVLGWRRWWIPWTHLWTIGCPRCSHCRKACCWNLTWSWLWQANAGKEDTWFFRWLENEDCVSTGFIYESNHSSTWWTNQSPWYTLCPGKSSSCFCK